MTTTLAMQDLANGTTGSIDPFTAFPDNYGYGTGGRDYPAVSADYGFQNAEPLSYNSSGTADALAVYFNDPNYNAYQNDTYIFTFSAVGPAGQNLGSVSSTVIAGTGAPVPEPPSIDIFGAGLLALLGLGLARRRRAVGTHEV